MGTRGGRRVGASTDLASYGGTAGIAFGGLVCAIAIFVFGSSYYDLFRSNRSRSYRIALPVLAGAAVFLLTRLSVDPSVRLLAIGVCAAATANLMGWSAAWLKHLLRWREDSIRGIACAAATGGILLVLVACRVPLSSVYLSGGRSRLGLGLGIGGLVLFAALAAMQARSAAMPLERWMRSLPWALAFRLTNAFMEELWFRGLFLRALASLVTPAAAVLLTAAIFAVAHVGATYLSKSERVRFVAMLFPLGAVWALCMHMTDSVLASTLMHAGADLIIVNGLLAERRQPAAKGDV